jgi:hypothetical protein
MKIILSFLMFAASHYCLAQTYTNLIGVGDWSEPVNDAGIAVRGRLLVYDHTVETAFDHPNHALVYLELQHIYPTNMVDRYFIVEIYYDPNMGVDNEPPGLLLELSDEHHQPPPSTLIQSFNGSFTSPYWITLPLDTTVRIRADFISVGTEETNGLNILGRPGQWTIPYHAINDYYLRGTFVSTKDHPSPLHYHIWQGTLELPPVKIPAKK